MTRKKPPSIKVDDFVYLWNTDCEISQIAEWFERSEASILSTAAIFRFRKLGLRERHEEVQKDSKVYLPSPEKIAEECLKIRRRRNGKPDEQLPLNPPLSKRLISVQEFLNARRRKPSNVNNLETLNDAPD